MGGAYTLDGRAQTVLMITDIDEHGNRTIKRLRRKVGASFEGTSTKE